MPSRTYSDAEITAKLAEGGHPGWYLEDGWLRKKFNTDGWPQTLMSVNAIGFVAEASNHHPDLAVTWGKFWVKLQTHDSGGITDKDFELAAKIDAALFGRPAAGTALAPGSPDKIVFVK